MSKAGRLYDKLTTKTYVPDGSVYTVHHDNPYLEAYESFAGVRSIVDASPCNDFTDVLKLSITADMVNQIIALLWEESKRENTLADFSAKMRVRTRPHTDAFMQGLQHGTVVKVGRKYVHVMFFMIESPEFVYRKLPPEHLDTDW